MFREHKDQRVYLFRLSTFADGIRESYWTGEWTDTGRPAVTGQVFQAKAFNSKREAYNEGGKYLALCHYKAGWRDPGVLQ